MDISNVSWPGWEVVRVIGRGSFGAVYEIERNAFGHKEQAALKVITIPQNAGDIDELYSDGYDEDSITEHFRNYMKDIVNEYYLMADMKGHTNVVYCDDLRYVQHDDGIGWDIYIKMELLTPLTKVLGKKISDEQVIRIGLDICSALMLCKDRNIVHRDIKPQNIFVSKDGNYKLGDFGIAKTAERTTSGTKVGTYKYMAPEVYNNQPYGAAADIYSLGLVMYWLLNERRSPFLALSGRVPKASEEELARERRFSGEQLPAPAHGSAELQAIVLKACAFDPKDRYASAQEMYETLAEIGTVKKAEIPVVVQETEKEETDDTSLPEQDEQTVEETETVGVFGRKKGNGQTENTGADAVDEQTFVDEDETVGVFGGMKGNKEEPNGGNAAVDADYLEYLYDNYTADTNEPKVASSNTACHAEKREKEKRNISNLIKLIIGAIIILIPIGYLYVHIWTDATCTEPAKCKVCGQTKGGPIGHQWRGSTHPKKCKLCGQHENDNIGYLPLEWSDKQVDLQPDSYSSHTSPGELNCTVVQCTRMKFTFSVTDIQGGKVSDKWALYGRNNDEWFIIDNFTYDAGDMERYTISSYDPVSFDALAVVPYEWYTGENQDMSWSCDLELCSLKGYIE